jgi:threonine dehydratase
MCATWWAGAARTGADERLFRFEFPERPGALMRFLAACTRLEHQPVPLPQPGRRLRPHPGGHPGAGQRRKAFRDFLRTLAYPHVEETHNPVYRLFLR